MPHSWARDALVFPWFASTFDGPEMFAEAFGAQTVFMQLFFSDYLNPWGLMTKKLVTDSELTNIK